MDRNTIFKHHQLILYLVILLLLMITWGDYAAAAERLQQTGNPVIVVIDPGHGGDNNGTTESGFLEKEMTMATAKSMYQTLTQFQNIEVYLTHWDDVDLSLKERAVFAAEKKADFLISLHYNASESHQLFGSEVWISLFPEFHNPGYQLGTCFLREFREMGLHLRGIKTKPHSNGKDYYGIIREAAAREIPSIIVEHCHVDHASDNSFCDSVEELEAFGYADALAVAKYFGLKSDSLGLDYSGENSLPEVNAAHTVQRAMYDQTEPDLCNIEIKEVSYEECRVTLVLNARDSDSNLIDYAYSLDEGKSFSGRLPLPTGDILTGELPDTYELELSLSEGYFPSVIVKVFNPYDLSTVSNAVSFTQPFQRPIVEPEPTEEPVFEDATALLLPEEEEPTSDRISILLDYIKPVLAVVAILFLICLTGFLILHQRNHSHRGRHSRRH